MIFNYKDKKNISEEISDEVLLVKKASQGEESAFAILVSRYREKLYKFLYFLLHHEEDTLDILQDTLIKSYEALPSLKEPKTFKCWIYRIAHNLAMNYIKKKERRKKHDKNLLNKNKHVESADETLEKKEIYEILNNLIQDLPFKQKSTLILCDIEGYSYKEIAAILKCRIGTVMSRIYYARKYIRENLEKKIDFVSDDVSIEFLKKSTQ